MDSASGQATSIGWEDNFESSASARFRWSVMKPELGLNSGKALKEQGETLLRKSQRWKNSYFSIKVDEIKKYRFDQKKYLQW